MKTARKILAVRSAKIPCDQRYFAAVGNGSGLSDSVRR
jgi:hypothetical protein